MQSFLPRRPRVLHYINQNLAQNKEGAKSGAGIYPIPCLAGTVNPRGATPIYKCPDVCVGYLKMHPF